MLGLKQGFMQENTPTVTTQRNLEDGPVVTAVTESDLKVTVEKELVSQAEEEDMEALLGTCVFFIFTLVKIVFLIYIWMFWQ